MAGFDFWRPPITEIPDSDGEHDRPAEGGPPHQSDAAPNAGASEPPFEPPLRLPPVKAELKLPENWSSEASSRGSPLCLDEAAVKAAGYPVKLASLDSYLRALTLSVPSDQGGQRLESSAVPPSALARTLAESRLWEVFGKGALPDPLGHAEGIPREALQINGTEVWRHDAQAEIATDPWRMDPSICGKLRAVPDLPNPFTVSTDCQALVAETLKDIPPQDWDAKHFPDPPILEGLPNLCHGPGGLLSPHTPRQLANNQLAAAIANRLCENLRISLARACHDHRLRKRISPEEQAVDEAKLQLKQAEKAAHAARREAQAAEGDLKAFLANYELDAERHRHLQAVAGWKTSAADQSDAELQEAQKALRAAEAAKAQAAAAGVKQLSWSQKWSAIVPAEVGRREVFAVRLAANGQLLYTLWEFIDAMQHGLVDRTRGTYVPKHVLEMAFVRSAADPLLLCSPWQGSFIHLPSPMLVRTGLSGSAERVPLPLHGLALRLEGQTFPFSLNLGASGTRLAFSGLGLQGTLYHTPWNPLQYSDILWASESQDSLMLAPLIMAVSDLVLDPELNLGPFMPVAGARDVLCQSMGLALLQALLFHDVKMWPVSLPPQTRSRLEFALRALRMVVGVKEEDVHSSAPRLPGVDEVRDEAFGRCLEALHKVPDDGDGGGGTPVQRSVLSEACGGFADRIKRMELSMLSSMPLHSSKVLRQTLEELTQMWPQFVEDTAMGGTR